MYVQRLSHVHMLIDTNSTVDFVNSFFTHNCDCALTGTTSASGLNLKTIFPVARRLRKIWKPSSCEHMVGPCVNA